MKYIVDLPDAYTSESALLGDILSIPTGIKLEPYNEPGRKAIDLQHARDIENVAKMNYNEGAKDAWDLVKTITYMGYDDFVSCFGDKIEEPIYELSYSEAKAKYDTWKNQKGEIRVGDEVFFTGDPDKEKAIVLWLYQPKQYKPLADIWWHDREIETRVTVEKLVRTGRHFDEVAELLKKMKEEYNEG